MTIPTITRNTPYGPLASETMDVYLPPSTAPTGAIILIHGGDWKFGDKSIFEAGSNTGFQNNIAAAFANHGVAVFNIDYTLFHGPNKWAQVYASVEAAVSYIKANAAAYNVNPAAIGAVGDSAGAQLASMLGVTGQVAFVGDNSGPVDLIHAASLNATTRAMVGTTWPALEAASPLDNIGPSSAPFFITQGLQDTTVLPSQAVAFNAALTEAGVSSTLVEYAGGHVFRQAPTAWNVLEKEVAWTEGQIARLTQAAAAFAPADGVVGRFEASEAVAGSGGLALVDVRR